jgi:hypothetical protein
MTADKPFTPDGDVGYVIEKLEQRVLAKHGGQAEPMMHHWNLTEGDSAMHKEAAALLRNQWNAAIDAAMQECQRLLDHGKDDHRDSWMGNAIAAIERLTRK